MATGDTLCVFTPLHNQPQSSGYATLDSRNAHPVLDFDAAGDESAIFGSVLPSHYSGGGITATVIWTPTTAISGTCRWWGQFERMNSGFVIAADSYDLSGISTGAAAPTVSGALQYTALSFTNGDRMDGLLVNEAFRFRLTRDADGTTGTDDMTGDAELVRILFREA